MRVLETSVASSFGASRLTDHDEWQAVLSNSDVRLQWDPDHDPSGNGVERRAVQLGLRGAMLRRYSDEELLGIEDITPLVATQRAHLRNDYRNLTIPSESVYQPSIGAAESVGIDPSET